MLANIFLELAEFSWFRRAAWKPTYNHLAKQEKMERFPSRSHLRLPTLQFFQQLAQFQI